MHYVPNIPEVLFHTRLVNPQETVKLQFTAPQQPGDYPYVCTFPGHWSLMNGVMKVVKSKTAL
jgi:azurin